MNMKRVVPITVAVAGIAWSFAWIGWSDEVTQTEQVTRTERVTTTTPTQTVPSKDTPAFLQQWPEGSRTIAAATIDKYGRPDEFTEGQLVWHARAPWNRIVVYRFPANRYEALAQTIDYNFPAYNMPSADFYNAPGRIPVGEALVLANKNSMELTALSNSESNNILALNLANDVYRGNKSPKEAGDVYAQIMTQTLSGKTSPYTEHVIFTPRKPTLAQVGQTAYYTTEPEVFYSGKTTR